MKKTVLDANDTPFFTIDAPVQEVSLPVHKLQFHEVTIGGRKIVLGLAKRSARLEARQRLIEFADQISARWNQVDREMLETMKKRNALARAEEFILSRLMIDQGIPLHASLERNAGKIAFVSITHSSSTVAVAISSTPVGIDHEIIKQRPKEWRLKMDPFNQVEELQALLQQWSVDSRAVAETVAWCVKEATLKVYGMRKNIETLPGISIQIKGFKIITFFLGMDGGGMCETHVMIDQEDRESDVLAIAIIPRDTA